MRYWQPALLSSELAEKDGAPLRVGLLAEDLIAFRELGAAHHWRHIAESNGIDDPWALRPGQRLVVGPPE